MRVTSRNRMLLLAALLVLAGGLSSLPAMAEETPPTPEIVGGQEVTPPGRYPFMVALVDSGRDAYSGQFCGGALISSRWVLTAAHCIQGETPSSVDVVIGKHDLEAGGGERIDVVSIIEHPAYDDATTVNDVAVLLLASDSSFASVTLPSDGSLDTAGRLVTITGWGDTESIPRYPAELQQVIVPIVSDADCTGAYGSEFDAASMICAGELELGGKDSCQGDSGGPLFVETGDTWTQLGIVSWGNGCADPGDPGVYSRVSALQGWITETTGVLPGGGPPPTCAGRPATIWGASEGEPLTGTDGRDVIVGTDGADLIDGMGGNDLICGNGGDDTINGGSGRDKIFGGPGEDTINGGPGNDNIHAGTDQDSVWGGSGNDILRGSGQDDVLRGNIGRDVLIGGGGVDAAYGGPGPDTCSAEIAASCS